MPASPSPELAQIEVGLHGEVLLAATLCSPSGGLPPGRVAAPGMVLIGGTGGDTRDGDPDPAVAIPPAGGGDGAEPGRSGLLRAIAHRLAAHGVASLRYDKRGCGRSGGRADEASYDTDLADALTAVDWLLGRPECGGVVGVIGHSAGAMIAGRVNRERPQLAAVGLLAALYGPADAMIERNWGRVARYWSEFGPRRQAWLIEHRPADVVRGFGVEEFLAAVRQGAPTVRLAAHGHTLILRTGRARHDMLHRQPAEEPRAVRAPALVLHGTADLNVRVADAWDTVRALRATGNAAVEPAVLPGLDHTFRAVSPDWVTRAWERVSGASLHHPVDVCPLDLIGRWAARVLGEAPGVGEARPCSP
ncbi:MAG: alpha/beta hydrolase family protein [Pseudonocardiaceae bacterium]